MNHKLTKLLKIILSTKISCLIFLNKYWKKCKIVIIHLLHQLNQSQIQKAVNNIQSKIHNSSNKVNWKMIMCSMIKKILKCQKLMKLEKAKIFLKRKSNEKAFFGKKTYKEKLIDLRKNCKSSKSIKRLDLLKEMKISFQLKICFSKMMPM